MFKSLAFLLFVSAFVVICLAAPAQQTPPAPSLEKVSEGVYAWIQAQPLRFFAANCAVVLTDTETLIVDAPTQPAEARALLAAIRNVTDKPVRYLVLSHWHNDHTQSDSVFRAASPEDFAIISTAATREDVAARARPDLDKEKAQFAQDIKETEEAVAAGKMPDGRAMTEDDKARYQRAIDRAKARLPELKALQIELPEITFADQIVLHRPGREIHLISFRGHTRGDAVVYLPQERILISGDLVDDMPYVGHGYPAEYVETLRKLEAMDFDTVIPGHGAVKHGKDHVLLLIQAYSTLVEQVRIAQRAGLSLEETQKKVDIEAFRFKLTPDDGPAQRMYRRSHPENVARAYAEAVGTIKD